MKPGCYLEIKEGQNPHEKCVLDMDHGPRCAHADVIDRKERCEYWKSDINFVYQTRLGRQGNCFEACIASILKLEIEEVPDLAAYEKDGTWVARLNKWLSKGHGLTYMECHVMSSEKDIFIIDKQFYHIIISETTEGLGSGVEHAVVGKKLSTVFDPCPTPLTLIPSDIIKIGVLVKSFM